MDQSIAQEKRETLAQMGIKKGSRIWPLMSLAIIAAIFIVGFQQSGNRRVNDLFATLCGNARGVVEQALASGPGGSPEAEPKKSHPLVRDCRARAPDQSIQDLVDKFSNKGLTERADLQDGKTQPAVRKMQFGERLDVLMAFPQVPGTLVWRDYRAVASAYAEELAGDFKDITASLFLTIVLLGLVALVPGILGLIYRRSFWSYFLIAFAVLYALNASSPIIPVDPLPESGTILLFVLSQIVVLFLALRLRRYSMSPPVQLGAYTVPPALYNGILAAILVLVGLACLNGWGPGNWPFGEDGESSFIWSFLGTGITGFVFTAEFLLVGLPILYALFRQSILWVGDAPKNIIICLDGTTNTPDQYEFGRPAQTNVFKLFNMLKSDAPSRVTEASVFDASISKRYDGKQIAFYYSGVGNRFDSSPIGQLLGGATGMGAAGMVDRAYLDVMRVYRPQDRIFIFGFSRGAAIARLLARAIDQKGAPRTLWTIRAFGRHWTVWCSRHAGTADATVPISVLGCWDTVGAFGIAKTFAGIDFQKIDLFKDLTVPDNVSQAYHMVALDERRKEFRPTLMDPDPIRPERIVEVWFSGDHANVGGGWATTKLSDVTLDFLLKHVSSGYAFDNAMTPGDESWGLYLSASKWETGDKQPGMLEPDPRGQLRQPVNDLYVYEDRKLPHHAVISETVFERMTKALPLYAPQSLFDHHTELSAKRAAVSAEIDSLTQTQSLRPAERAAILDFKDKLRLTRWPDYLEELIARLPTMLKPSSVLANEVKPESPA